jgi:hypothetical protein
MRRGLIAAFFVTLLVLCFAATGSAMGPTREPVFVGAETISGVCSFPVRLTPLVNREIVKVFPSGRALVTGRLLVRLTNMRTRASLVVNASGPATFVPRGDSFVVYARGRALLIFFPGELGPGSDGALLLVSGLAIEIFDPGGLTVLRLPPNRRNLCRALA